jgi:predicted aldo/keto reductase-like oxidoreductase
MKRTILGRTGIETGIIGLGLEHLEKASFEEVAATVEEALEAGACYMDLFMPSANIRDYFGRLMKGRRDRFQIQGHIGACLQNDGQYFRTREPARAERHAEDLLRRLGTDYLDTLMMHFVDEPEEWAEASAPGGILDIAQRWKEQGKARTVGMSSHKTSAAMAAVESGLVDILMFPVNPAFDLLPGETKLEALWEADPYTGLKTAGSRPVYSRRSLYLACERDDVAIVAMKTFAAGFLFHPDNPSGIVLTPVQCLQYALSQPGVRVVLPGCKTPEEMKAALAWLTASEEEKDYSAILGQTDWNLAGSCMYCNHCLPCPAGIDIAATIRLLDSARRQRVSPALSAVYDRLPAPASACIFCGDCEERCPFGVTVQSNMQDASALFEK